MFQAWSTWTLAVAKPGWSATAGRAARAAATRGAGEVRRRIEVRIARDSWERRIAPMGADLLQQRADSRTQLHSGEVLAFERVSKRHLLASGAELLVLSAVSFVVPAGATVAVVGRSGSGKSTL